MVTQIFSSVKDVRVAWIGLTRPDKNGRQKHSLQYIEKAQDGKVNAIYVSSEKPFDGVKVDDTISLDLRVSAYQGGLFCDAINVYPQNGTGKAKVGVNI